MKGVTGETKRAKRDKRPDEDARGKCTSEKEDEEEEGGISEREERISGRGKGRARVVDGDGEWCTIKQDA